MNELFPSLAGLLREFGDNPDLREAVIFAGWKKIAGEVIREQTSPVEITGKRLIVAASTEMWKNHLEALSGQMIFKLNSALGDELITFIEFRVDAKRVEAHASARARTGPEELLKIASEEITPQLKDSAEVIRDEELREHFLNAAARCLARKKILNAGN